MASLIQHRRDSAVNWAVNDPILADGEIGYDITNKLHKIGDGTSHWQDLPEYNPGSLVHMGSWDASGGSYPPNPEKGWYYVCSVAGLVNSVNYYVDDWATYNGSTWNKINNQTGSGSFVDAPVDGKSYVRKDAGWSEAGSGITLAQSIAMSIALG